ncbi:MAG: S8 family peptidase [Flavobacteriales bacterium]|nr:S8 family peptidase [Flavobacteriales bacterium]
MIKDLSRKIFAGFVVLALTFNLSAQVVDNYVENEILVQISSEHFSKDLEQAISTNAELMEKELLSRHMRIWRLRFNEIGSTNDFIQALKSIEGIEEAQLNHILSLRNQPNDPQYSSQWQHFNQGGSNGGLLDADIDTEEAWDITTGGTTFNGDTIVVAVIDDGIDEFHPDIEENLWFNHNEIPNNGIDDDGNGFIDDHKGWNVDDNDDNIAGGFWGGGHGTPVAGIIGAKGNNNVGVAGVNWTVKLMIIVGGPSEARAIQSYDYALQNRILYNSSFGSKGAFVVATNSSWGVDFGQPSQSPLWCAFYDSLGIHGVLSAGATINDNQNVDVIGDLPTACPSDYMIAVTNTDKFDSKVTFAGYGSTTIDLGAPGEGTYTTSASGQLYDGFGGTSGATPHVAGTIGLLYSIPCENFSNLALQEPNVAALKVKEYIFATTDSLSDLAGVTVTGGRLNVHKAVVEAMDNCDTQLSINEQLDLQGIDVFPNPVSDNLQVQVKTGEIQFYQLFDQQGRLINTNNGLLTQNVTIDTRNFDLGLYFLKVSKTNGEVHNVRFVKQ